jgi:proteasome accessory factor B
VSRIERLVNLTSALLYTRRPLQADEIFELVPGYPPDKGSSHRQFERDKEALRQLGLPLSVESIDGSTFAGLTGYRIRPDEYFLRDPGLAPDELSALHLAAQTVRYGDDSAQSGLWKLGFATGSSVSMDRAGLEAAASLPTAGPLAVLFESISQRRSITFTYRGERRHVAGRRLVFRNGHWYFASFDRTRNDDRSFRVDRMENPVELADDDGFELPVAIDNEGEDADRAKPFDFPWELGDEAPVVAEVMIDQPHARWAAARLGPNAVVTQTDQATVFRFQVRNVDAFRSFVLGFLHHAEVVSPPHLREDLLAWIAMPEPDLVGQ